jgi:hypothetical protein
VRDSKVMSVDDANNLADVLVEVYKQPTKIYDFDVTDFSAAIVSGDVITINSPAQDLTNEEVRIVSITRGMRADKEFMTLQVTNKEYSRCLKNYNLVVAGIDKRAQEENTYMQGTTNILTFSEMINANSTAPLRINAYLPTEFIFDEAGNNRVNSFILDYDVDPYRRGVGTASETDVAPDVSGSSANTAPNVSGSSANTAPGVTGSAGSNTAGVSGSSAVAWEGTSVGTDSSSSVTCGSDSWTAVCGVGTDGTNKRLYADFYIAGNSSGPDDIKIRLRNTGEISSTDSRFQIFLDGFENSSVCRFDGQFAGTDGSSDAIYLEVYPYGTSIVVDGYLDVYYASHSHADGTYGADSHDHSDGSLSADNHLHADGSYAADSHPHADGTYGAASHNHSVSVGDGVSDSGSLNATQVSIYLDFWNVGTSTWDNKYSILNTGKTIDYDVDISNSGIYPDAAGYWRARIITDNASADLVQGIIKVKHELDT